MVAYLSLIIPTYVIQSTKLHSIALDFVGNSVTRGNSYKLRHSHCKYDLRRQMFTNRIVAKWNSLPDYVVDAHRVNVFKNSLDRHWCTHELFMIMSPSNSELETVVFIKLKC